MIARHTAGPLDVISFFTLRDRIVAARTFETAVGNVSFQCTSPAHHDVTYIASIDVLSVFFAAIAHFTTNAEQLLMKKLPQKFLLVFILCKQRLSLHSICAVEWLPRNGEGWRHWLRRKLSRSGDESFESDSVLRDVSLQNIRVLRTNQ